MDTADRIRVGRGGRPVGVLLVALGFLMGGAVRAAAPAAAPAAPSAVAATPAPSATPVAAAVPSATTAPVEAAPPAEPVATPPPAEPAPQPAAEGPEKIGAAACLACHSDREGFHDNIHAKAWPKAKHIEYEESCETCHGPGSLHAAAAGDKAHPGFASIRGKAELKSSKGAETCLTCHAGSARLHWEGSRHESRDVGCASCHDVHAGRPRLLAAATEMETCLTCHKNMKAELRRNSHHPVIEGKVTCSDCHNPHGTSGPKLLVGNSVNDTCFKCHTEKRGPFLWEHRPVSEACTNCHLPHGSVHNKLMRERLPYLCQSCHSASNHPGTIYAVNPTAPGKLPGQKLNNRTLYRACVDCHANIHGSNHPSGKTFTR